MVVKRKKRFHLLGLPHLVTNKKEALACAFSQKVIKMAMMLKSLGHYVAFYGVEGSDGVACSEFIPVSTKDVLRKAYGDYDHYKQDYKHNPTDIAYKTFNTNAIKEISKRKEPTDFLLIPFSPAGYRGIINAFYTPYINDDTKLHLIVEMGIGYRFPMCTFKVFESYSQMHYVWGLQGLPDGRPYDVVIPNYFDPGDFEYRATADKGDYFLYLGRIIKRKGIAIAKATVEAIDGKLVLAGQDGGENVDMSGPNCEYVGFADLEKRRELLAGAKGLFLPTKYVEPFGGTIIEGAYSGTPVLTSGWGAFSELVIHGKTGFRCHVLDHYVWAAKNIATIRSSDCRDYAMSNFSLDVVKWKYEEYWDMLLDIKLNVDGKAWKRIHPERTQLDWLRRWY